MWLCVSRAGYGAQPRWGPCDNFPVCGGWKEDWTVHQYLGGGGSMTPLTSDSLMPPTEYLLCVEPFTSPGKIEVKVQVLEQLPA